MRTLDYSGTACSGANPPRPTIVDIGLTSALKQSNCVLSFDNSFLMQFTRTTVTITRISFHIFTQGGRVRLGKAYTCSQSFLTIITNAELVSRRSTPTTNGKTSDTSFFNTSFLQAISAVMLWSVLARQIPQASQHFRPAKLYRSPVIFALKASLSPFSFSVTPTWPRQ